MDTDPATPDSLPADEAQATGAEGRMVLRRTARDGTRVDLQRIGSDVPAFEAKLMDVSQFGARLQSASSVIVGEELEVKFTPPGGRKVRPVRATVRWCAPIDGGAFAIGVQLQSGLSPIELKILW